MKRLPAPFISSNLYQHSLRWKKRSDYVSTSLLWRHLGFGYLLLIITALITQASDGFLYYSCHSGFCEKSQGKDTLWMTGWRMQSWPAPQQVDTFLNEDHVLLKATYKASCSVLLPHTPATVPLWLGYYFNPSLYRWENYSFTRLTVLTGWIVSSPEDMVKS